VKAKEEGSSYQVQLKLSTGHKKGSLHKMGEGGQSKKNRLLHAFWSQSIKEPQSCSNLGRVTCECWGPVGPWLCKEAKINEERISTNCA
jgi:hypothetical protein